MTNTSIYEEQFKLYNRKLNDINPVNGEESKRLDVRITEALNSTATHIVDGFRGMDYSDNEYILLESISPFIVFFRMIFIEFSGIWISASVIPLYGLHYPISTIGRWFSDWAMFIAIPIYIICFVASMLILYFYRLGKDPSTVNTIRYKITRIWVNRVCMLRDILLFPLFCQLVMTTTSFWISYAQNPYIVYLEAYISHGYMLFHTILLYLFTTAYISNWSLWISIFYTICYYFFVVARRLIVGEWVYPGLDPAQNQYWFLIVFGMPVLQIILYEVWRIVNYVKNKFYVYMQTNYFKLDLVHIRLTFTVDPKSYWLVNIMISGMIMSIFSVYVLVISAVLAWWFGLWVVVFDFIICGLDLIYFGCMVVFQVTEIKLNASTKEISIEKIPISPPWTKLALMASILIQIGVLIGYFALFLLDFGTIFGWYLFAKVGFSVLELPLKWIANRYFSDYKYFRPKYFSNMTLFSHYFG